MPNSDRTMRNRSFNSKVVDSTQIAMKRVCGAEAMSQWQSAHVVYTSPWIQSPVVGLRRTETEMEMEAETDGERDTEE